MEAAVLLVESPSASGKTSARWRQQPESKSRKVEWGIAQDNDGDRDDDDRAHEGNEHRSRVSVRGDATGPCNEEEHLVAKLASASETIVSRIDCDANISPSVARDIISPPFVGRLHHSVSKQTGRTGYALPRGSQAQSRSNRRPIQKLPSRRLTVRGSRAPTL